MFPFFLALYNRSEVGIVALWAPCLYVTCSGLLPRLGKGELILLLSFACNYVVSVRRGFLLVFVMGSIILL